MGDTIFKKNILLTASDPHDGPGLQTNGDQLYWNGDHVTTGTGSNWNKNGDNIYYNDGFVGIGTNSTDIHSNLHVVGNVVFSNVGTALTITENNSNIEFSTNVFITSSLSSGGIAIGYEAGTAPTEPSYHTIAIGNQAGYTGQNVGSVAIGTNAGQNGQNAYSVAIGIDAGQKGQGINSIAIGRGASRYYQGEDAISIGFSAGGPGGPGGVGQGNHGIAIGTSAASGGNQGSDAIAIGRYAGQTEQGPSGIALGYQSGYNAQGSHGLGIGNYAGKETQGKYAIALGQYAGENHQGDYSIAIGRKAGTGTAAGADKSIVLNASGSNLEATQSGFFVKPIRNVVNGGNTPVGGPTAITKSLYLNKTTNELFTCQTTQILNYGPELNGSTHNMGANTSIILSGTSAFVSDLHIYFETNINEVLNSYIPRLDSWFVFDNNAGVAGGNYGWKGGNVPFSISPVSSRSVIRYYFVLDGQTTQKTYYFRLQLERFL
jgi:hypothetical protein